MTCNEIRDVYGRVTGDSASDGIGPWAVGGCSALSGWGEGGTVLVGTITLKALVLGTKCKPIERIGLL